MGPLWIWRCQSAYPAPPKEAVFAGTQIEASDKGLEKKLGWVRKALTLFSWFRGKFHFIAKAVVCGATRQ